MQENSIDIAPERKFRGIFSSEPLTASDTVLTNKGISLFIERYTVP